MVMGEVSLCRVEELPPTFARELRPALAKSDPAVLFVLGGHAPESCHWDVGKPFPQRFQRADRPARRTFDLAVIRLPPPFV